MSLKDSWKEAGKGLGKSFAGLGKTIIKSAEKGVDAIDPPPASDKPQQEEDLREDWKKVGKTFGETGKSLGKAFAGTARKVIDAIDEEPEEKSGTSDGESTKEDTDSK